MSDKHTPGPWRVDPENNGDIQTHDGREIALVLEKQDHGAALCISGVMAADVETAIANARLIAAAPEMLAALRELLAWARDVWDEADTDEMERAAAAIAKATGDAP